MLAVAAGLVELQDGRLLAVSRPKVAGSFLPAVQARLVLPMVVLASHNHRGLLPDQALPHGPASVLGRASEVVALRVSVPDVKHRSGFHHHVGSGVSIAQELSELIVAHLVVFDGQLFLRAALVGHVVRWICQPHVHQLAASKFGQVVDAGRVTAQKAVLSHHPDVAWNRDMVFLYGRSIVRIGEAVGALHRHQRRDLLICEPHQVQIKPKITQLTQLERQKFVVPACIKRQLVVGNDVGPLLGLRPARGYHHRHLGHLKPPSGL
jgi:hypothetical protein